MKTNYSILPCNGLDIKAGAIAREIALQLAEKYQCRIICPMLFRFDAGSYDLIIDSHPLLVIDGCETGCASQAAEEKALLVAQKMIVTDEVLKGDILLKPGQRLDDDDLLLCDQIIKKLLAQEQPAEKPAEKIPEESMYDIYRKDKDEFRVPKSGFYFNTNESWAYVVGGKARIGVTDYVQKSLSDICFFSPPEIGIEVIQFDALGEIESGKSIFTLRSPVSGLVTAINQELFADPKLINENPYEQGWLAEIKLSDFAHDQQQLLDGRAYFQMMKDKVNACHEKKDPPLF